MSQLSDTGLSPVGREMFIRLRSWGVPNAHCVRIVEERYVDDLQVCALGCGALRYNGRDGLVRPPLCVMARPSRLKAERDQSGM